MTMNSLEWINKQIANINDIIEENQIRLDENQLFEFLKEHYQTYHKELIELSQTLQQIKAELEAWEVVQGTIVEGQDGDGHYCYIETVYFTGKKGEKVKKGLYNDETR